ncbi:uncharacterized protein LOC129771637 isoform X2 [Toxorhynchites rutilus septentrionalis]|uniref:uncharacterized protein LOC129771637 isoform X2 n=1 Tax=Toxorhynchites rutilus septentrionalis TaxID=329112 RepID=UPI002479BBCB|nr:uncharacterized protein LOC129771637 isoform X2 [Toxorhynchites rutilus septentrionalis]
MGLSERQEKRHKNRIAEYNLNLPCYVSEIRKLDPIVLDGNILAYIEDLIKLLIKIREFEWFEEPADDDINFNGRNVSFTLGCKYCGQKNIGAFELIIHIMDMNKHVSLTGRCMFKLRKLRDKASSAYTSFLNEERAILERNGFFERIVLENILNFYLITKSFHQLTTRYVNSLSALGCLPSTIVARGALDLLKELGWLMSRAQCVKSNPNSNMILMYKVHKLCYKIEDSIFDLSDNALKHAKIRFGSKCTVPENRNFFSVRPPVVPQHVPHTIGPFQNPPPVAMNILHNQALHPTGAPVFRTNYPINRPIVRHPIPSPYPPPLMSLRLPCPPPDFRRPPPFPPNRATLPPLHNTVQPNIPPLHNTVQHNVLPPLSTSGTAENPIFSATVKQFLKEPKLDGLIEDGNTLKHFPKCTTITAELERALHDMSYNVKVSCFGIKITGVGYEEDNINLYVNDGEKTKTDESIKLLYDGLTDFFAQNVDDWMILTKKEDGVRSYLTVKNHCESISCRISFASEIYCANTRLIQYYLKSFPICQRIFFYVLEFTKLMEMDLPRYVCITLVIFWLQMKDEAPSVAKLQADLTEEEWCGNWLVNFVPKTRSELKLQDCEIDFRKHASDFFLFYGCKFSFSESIVSPHDGSVLNRRDFSAGNESRLPQRHYKSYLEHASREDRTAPRFNNTTPMCVQDLLDLSINIAATITPRDTDKFVRICKMAYECCMSEELGAN